jgi:hypothetical protein
MFLTVSTVWPCCSRATKIITSGHKLAAPCSAGHQAYRLHAYLSYWRVLLDTQTMRSQANSWPAPAVVRLHTANLVG